VAGHLIYHWKHGWIPLTHAAALSKAHGSAHLADKYVPGASTHHTSVATHGRSARDIHATLEKHARITARPGTYRGAVGHHITGTDTRGRRVAVFVPGDRAAAQRAIDNLHAGKPAFAPGAGPDHKSAGPANAAEAFRMTGPELRQHAANGSTVAKAELDRRGAKHKQPSPSAPAAKQEPSGAQAKSLTPADLHAQNKGDLKVGDQVALKAGGRTRVGTVQGFDATGRAQVNVPGHGTVSRTAADVTKDIHPATRAAQARATDGDWSKTPTPTLQRALGNPEFSPRMQDAMRAELQRRGITPNAPTTPTPSAPRTTYADKTAEAAARWNAENARIAPPGHTITSKALGTTNAGTPQGFHSQSLANGDRVGSVIEQRDGGGYRAVFDGKSIGTYPTRVEAHAALAEKHRAAAEAAAKKTAQATASRERKSAQAARGLAGWEPHQLQSDGTRAGDAAAAKVKQSFKFGSHTVHIETSMTQEQTKGFLSDVHAVLLKAGLHDHPDGITIHVPSGDKTVPADRGSGTTGAYVRQRPTRRSSSTRRSPTATRPLPASSADRAASTCRPRRASPRGSTSSPTSSATSSTASTTTPSRPRTSARSGSGTPTPARTSPRCRSSTAPTCPGTGRPTSPKATPRHTRSGSTAGPAAARRCRRLRREVRLEGRRSGTGEGAAQVKVNLDGVSRRPGRPRTGGPRKTTPSSGTRRKAANPPGGARTATAHDRAPRGNQAATRT
jgi:hypothetical protein